LFLPGRIRRRVAPNDLVKIAVAATSIGVTLESQAGE
jgi:hypothetical protein